MQRTSRDQAESLAAPDTLSTPMADRRHHAQEPDEASLAEVESNLTTDTPDVTSKTTHLPIQRLGNEIFFLSLAAASLVGLVILLKCHENKPTPQWSFGNWGVTLNAIISIVSAVFHGSVMEPVAQTISQFTWIWYMQPRPLNDLVYYDSASRGPLGSARLLFRLRFMHFASIGAIITLAALALDPSFQQSVQYVSREAVATNQKAQAVTAYSWGDNMPIEMTFTNFHGSIPYNMKAALRSGLLASNPLSLPSPPFSCPTGNCTWSPFATIGVGAQCQDVTSHVRIECPTVDNYNEPLCQWVAPEDDALGSLVSNTTEFHVFMLRSTIPIFWKWSPSYLLPYLNDTVSLAIVQWVKTLDDYILGPETKFEAVTCNFYMSVKEVLPQVINGAYSEQVLQEVTRPDPVQGLNYSNEDFPENWFTSPYDEYEPIIYHLNRSEPSGISNNYTFVLNQIGYYELSSQFTQDYDFLRNGVVMTEEDGVQPVGPTTLIMLWQANNTTLAMYNVAEAATTQMRANATDILQQEKQDPSLIAPEQAIDGEVWVRQQFVVIRWDWLILPIVLLVLAALFLLASFVKTRSKQIGLWQSSPLALFFHARPGNYNDQEALFADAGSLDTADAMRETASLLTARIPIHDRGIIEVYPKAGLGDVSKKDVMLMQRDSLEMENLRG